PGKAPRQIRERRDVKGGGLGGGWGWGRPGGGGAGKSPARRFPPQRFPDGLARLIHEGVRGNPLFMVNVVDYLEAEGLIAERGGQWRLNVALAELELGVPEGVRQMIEKQIDRLSQDQRQALEVACVAGAEFDVASVAA